MRPLRVRRIRDEWDQKKNEEAEEMKMKGAEVEEKIEKKREDGIKERKQTRRNTSIGLSRFSCCVSLIVRCEFHIMIVVLLAVLIIVFRMKVEEAPTALMSVK